MFTVGAVYTAEAIVGSVSSLLEEEMPDCRVINFVDSGLIHDIIRDKGIEAGTARRLFHLINGAADAGVDVIFNTCSSVGELADSAQSFVPMPILRIDRPMAATAVASATRIGVMATLPSTLAPTMRLVQSEAQRAGKDVEVVEGLAEGAYQSLVSGDPDTHDTALMETAVRLAKQTELIVLAQGSMARMEQALAKKTGKPVLSSTRSGVGSVKEFRDSSERRRSA